MATYVAVVRYADHQVQFGLFYSTDTLGRQLYASEGEARAAIGASGKPEAPAGPEAAEEPVTVHPYELYGNPESEFCSRASRQHAWLTGPASTLDAAREAEESNPWGKAG